MGNKAFLIIFEILIPLWIWQRFKVLYGKYLIKMKGQYNLCIGKRLQKWFRPIVLDTYCNDLSCKEEIDLEKLLHLFHTTCVIPVDSISIVVQELSESSYKLFSFKRKIVKGEHIFSLKCFDSFNGWNTIFLE